MPGDRQRVASLVDRDREAAAADEVADGQVSPLQLDLRTVHAPRRDVRKSRSPHVAGLDVGQISPEPPNAVADLADVVHPAVVASPCAGECADILRVVGGARDRGQVAGRRRARNRVHAIGAGLGVAGSAPQPATANATVTRASTAALRGLSGIRSAFLSAHAHVRRVGLVTGPARHMGDHQKAALLTSPRTPAPLR